MITASHQRTHTRGEIKTRVESLIVKVLTQDPTNDTSLANFVEDVTQTLQDKIEEKKLMCEICESLADFFPIFSLWEDVDSIAAVATIEKPLFYDFINGKDVDGDCKACCEHIRK